MTPSLSPRGLATAAVLLVVAPCASAASTDLTCKWTHPKNPTRTDTVTLSVDAVQSKVTHSRGATHSVKFSPAEISFKVRDSTGFDWGDVLNRTTLVLTETNLTTASGPTDYACQPVQPKV